MKLIIFTTCKPFINDDAWRQEQAIKSWTLLENIEKKIIIIGNDKGTKEICEKYNLIHEPNIKTFDGVPYFYEMFLIANKYANDDDIMFWTNSDMIYFQSLIINIYLFKLQKPNIKNYMLIGQRYDWMNPKMLDNLNEQNFKKNMNINIFKETDPMQVKISKTDSKLYEVNLHVPCGIDYVIHSKTSVIDYLNKQLVIAGTKHDILLVGIGLKHNMYVCDITKTNFVIHQNHDYINIDKDILHKRKINNINVNDTIGFISHSPYKTLYDSSNNIIFT